MESRNRICASVFLVTCLIFAAFLSVAIAEQGQLFVKQWKEGVSFTLDGNVWNKTPPPVNLPVRAVYDAAKGLWAITLDDGRVAYVESRSFGLVDGTVPCETDPNGPEQSLEIRGFKNGKCQH